MVDRLVSKARSLAGNPSDEGLLAPSPVYLTGEEQLRVSTIGNTTGVTLTVRGRVLRPDFDVAITEFTHAPNSNRTLASATRTLSEGWPLAFEVKATAGTPAFGAVWCLLELVRGDGAAAVVVESLGYGFVTANQPYQWPNGENFLATDGPGHLRSITGTLPGAGVEISETVPTGARWALIAIYAQLFVANAGANRQVNVTFDDGTNVYFRSPNVAALAINNTWFLSWGTGLSLAGQQSGFTQGGGFPAGLVMGAGHRFKTITINRDVADQYTAPTYLVRETFDV